ncbi:hypothetical protein [Actinopolyspora alba]
MRADPAFIAELGNELERSTEGLRNRIPAPRADAGPSTQAIAATVAEVLRAAAGLTETTFDTADDLHANRATYATVEDDNTGRFEGLESPR